MLFVYLVQDELGVFDIVWAWTLPSGKLRVWESTGVAKL